MRKIVVGIIAVAILLGGMVACTEEGGFKLWDSMVVLGAESQNTTSVEGNIMAVFYLKADERVVYWCINSQIIDRGDGKWDVYNWQGLKTVEGINQALVDYELYSCEPLPNPSTTTYYLYELDLQEVTWVDLPNEQHVAKLIDVTPSAERPVTARRKYMGKDYDVPCYVEQDLVNLWLAEELEVGDWVHIAFIHDMPSTDGLPVAVATGKIYKSW